MIYSCSSTIRCIFILQIIIFHHSHPHPHAPYCSICTTYISLFPTSSHYYPFLPSYLFLCVLLSVTIAILITACNDLQLQKHYSLHIHMIDYYFSSHSSSSSYTLLLCMSLSTYHYFPPHLMITPSFILLIYFSGNYLQ